MKYLIYALLFLCPFSADAQYAAFPTPGLEFGIVYTYGYSFKNTSLRYVGDEIFEGKIWGKFAQVPNNYPFWYLRADQGKYYVYWNTVGETLYLDFTKEAGDTLKFCSNCSKILVLETGYITLLNGETRKKMRVQSFGDTWVGPIRTWVDGIGDLDKGFFGTSDFEGGYSQLICAHDDLSDVFYHTPGWNLDCDSLLCPVPKPKFEYECQNGVFHFTNQTELAETYFWDFGDGESSTEFEPTHIFTNPGCYQVTLKAKTACLPQDYISKRRISVQAPNYWKPISAQTPTTFLKVQYLTPQKAWAISDHTIWKTVDGGMHWDSTIYPGAIRNLRDMHFKDFEHGIVAIAKPTSPSNSNLLWTDDGVNWVEDSTEFSYFSTSLERVNDSTAVTFVFYRGILGTKDGGHTWTKAGTSETGVTLIYDFDVIGGDTLYCIGSNEVLPWPDSVYFVYSTDAVHWHSILTPATGEVYAMDFVDAQTGWFAVKSAVYHTTNGGLNWTLQADLPENILQMRFADHLHGWACGSNTGVYATSDGGQNWTQQSCIRVEETLSDLSVLSPESAYLLAPEGILTYSQVPDASYFCNTSGVSEIGSGTEPAFSIRPNPANDAFDIQWNTSESAPEQTEIALYNMQGVEQLRVKLNAASNIPVAQLQPGVYILQVFTYGRRYGDAAKLVICR
jgi:photosystem II stability/assembly factor-like uncharacterized protein/PKD repeat protein